MVVVDQTVVRRWLAAITLRARAADATSRGSSVEAGATLVVCDAASETVLGLLADQSGVSSHTRDPFERILARAQDTCTNCAQTMDANLVRSLRVTHGHRNAVVHHGQEATPSLAEEALAATNALLDVLGRVLSALRLVPPEGGVASAVASIIDAPDLAEHLRGADAAIASGDVKAALDHVAIGLALAQRRATPPLGDPRHQWRHDVGRELSQLFETQERRTRVLEQWLVPLALGTSPAGYARMLAITGRTMETGAGWRVHRDPEAVASLADAQNATAELARIVVRLREIGTLIEGPDDEVWRKQDELAWSWPWP